MHTSEEEAQQLAQQRRRKYVSILLRSGHKGSVPSTRFGYVSAVLLACTILCSRLGQPVC